MLNFIIRRFVFIAILLVLVSIVSFITIQLPPGDWLSAYVTALKVQGAQINEEIIEGLKIQYGLELPPVQQYFRWVTGLLQGDFGFSFSYSRPVADLLAERLPATIGISVLTIIVTYAIAIPIGIYSATHQYSPLDYTFSFLGFIGLSMPSFLLALILMFVGYKYFGLSIGGLNSPEFIGEPMSWAKFSDMLAHLPIPILIISLSGTAGLIRVLRGTLLDEIRKPYVDTARAKGLKERVLLYRYPVRIAINPLISTIGWLLPSVFSGQVIVSIVLNLPTVGPLLYEALRGQDTYLAGSIVMILSFFTVIGTLLSDILLAIVDPRIRIEE
ncbi:MAG: ABC transporter permease [Chloroflexi bacterium]|nr:ABC transporter permease [Chloroflexota bacterium]